MSETNYRVIRNGKAWAIDQNGQTGGEYATKEAAFEAAVLAASNAIKEGMGVRIAVPERAPGETAIGGKS
jgi:hypothetical protein